MVAERTDDLAPESQAWIDDLAEAGGLALTVDGPDEACVGGTSARIVVVDGAETIVDLVIGQCDGSARAATDAVDQWIEVTEDRDTYETRPLRTFSF